MIVEHIPNVVAAACTLHNLCEAHGEHFNKAWLQDVGNEQSNQPITVGVRDRSGDRPKHVREAIVEYIRSKQNQ